VKLLANPVFLRMALVFIAGAFAFVLGTALIRRMRRSLLAEESIPPAGASSESLPLQTYHAVIQELKQQKHELESQQRLERRRSKTSENISAAVLSHLSSGVLFVDATCLVRQANPAARQILGFGSPVGMRLADLFRDAKGISGSSSAGPPSSVTLTATVEAALREKIPYRRLEGSYFTPGGEQRILDLTVTPVHAPSGETLGVACVINDESELAYIRKEQELRGEMSGEMALELRSSLVTISDCARQLQAGSDPAGTRRLAADIAAEAERLEHKIGGFLAGANSARAAGV